MIHNSFIIIILMGRLNWFILGSIVGSVQILNQVYENELLKHQLYKELKTIYRMKNFVFFPIINFNTLDLRLSN